MHLSHKLVAIGVVTVLLMFGSVQLLIQVQSWRRINNPFYLNANDVNGYDAAIQWTRDKEGRWQLLHGYIRGDLTGGGASLSNKPSRTLSSFGPHALDKGGERTPTILLFPGGLYINGACMTPTDRVKIFVVDKDSVVHRISLTAEEMQQIRPDTWPDQFSRTDLWRTKFLPIIDPERVARLAAGPSKPIYDVMSHSDDRVQVYEFGMVAKVDIPEASSELLNAFFSKGPLVFHAEHHRDDDAYKQYTYPTKFGHDVFVVHAYPSRMEVNGDVLKRGEVYARSPEGSIRLVELSIAEKQSLAMSHIRSEEFVKSDLYTQKILPILTGQPQQNVSP